jgi:hypothetical protein
MPRLPTPGDITPISRAPGAAEPLVRALTDSLSAERRAREQAAEAIAAERIAQDEAAQQRGELDQRPRADWRLPRRLRWTLSRR